MILCTRYYFSAEATTTVTVAATAVSQEALRLAGGLWRRLAAAARKRLHSGEGGGSGRPTLRGRWYHLYAQASTAFTGGINVFAKSGAVA